MAYLKLTTQFCLVRATGHLMENGTIGPAMTAQRTRRDPAIIHDSHGQVCVNLRPRLVLPIVRPLIDAFI